MIALKKVTRVKCSPPQLRQLMLGVAVDKEAQTVFIYLLIFSLKIWRDTEACCHWCGGPASRVAHDSGDGWALSWSCDDGNDCQWAGQPVDDIEWPFREPFVTAAEARAAGFKLV